MDKFRNTTDNSYTLCPQCVQDVCWDHLKKEKIHHSWIANI